MELMELSIAAVEADTCTRPVSIAILPCEIQPTLHMAIRR
jgi:hypothetical protein